MPDLHCEKLRLRQTYQHRCCFSSSQTQPKKPAPLIILRPVGACDDFPSTGNVRQALSCFSPGALIRRQPWNWQDPLMQAQTCCGATWTTWSASKATPSLSCTPSLLSSWLMLPCNHSRQVRPQPASDLRFLQLMLSLCFLNASKAAPSLSCTPSLLSSWLMPLCNQ